MKLASFEAIAAALEETGVRYLVAGGLAVAAHGYLRYTKDVELRAALRTSRTSSSCECGVKMTPNDKQDTEQIDWSLTTWEGARREQLRRWAELPLERIVMALEEMENINTQLSRR